MSINHFRFSFCSFWKFSVRSLAISRQSDGHSSVLMTASAGTATITQHVLILIGIHDLQVITKEFLSSFAVSVLRPWNLVADYNHICEFTTTITRRNLYWYWLYLGAVWVLFDNQMVDLVFLDNQMAASLSLFTASGNSLTPSGLMSYSNLQHLGIALQAHPCFIQDMHRPPLLPPSGYGFMEHSSISLTLARTNCNARCSCQEFIRSYRFQHIGTDWL